MDTRENWTNYELKESVRAYLEMLDKYTKGEKIVKRRYYEELASKTNRLFSGKQIKIIQI